MSSFFAGRRILITGASKGIGRAVAERLLNQGAHVIAVARNTADLYQLLHTYDAVTPIAVDVGDAGAVAKALASPALADVDGLVNNAGVTMNNPLLSATVDEWDRTLAVNVRSAFQIAQHAVRSMRDRQVKDGAIVQLSSVAASVAIDEHAAYAASKAALDALTRQLALEAGALGIRANSVSPTVTLTAMADREWSDNPMAADVLDRIPLRRFNAVDDVVDAVVYLLSDKASMITGQCLAVDGGFTAAPFNAGKVYDLPPSPPENLP